MPLDDDELTRRLDAVPLLDPPPGLTPDIMAAIRATPRRGRGLSAFAPREGRRLRFAAGWAVAAAIILLFLTVARPRTDAPPFATMAPTGAPATTTYQGGGVTLTARVSNGILLLEPAYSGGGPVTITVRWDPQSVVSGSVSGAADASSAHNQTTFTLRSPSQHAVVALRVRPEARSTEVRLSVEGEEVIRAEVPLR